MLSETFNAVATQDEPNFERTESASEGEMPVPIVDDRACIALFRPEEERCDVQGLCEVCSVADPERRCVKVDETPLSLVRQLSVRRERTDA